MLSNDLEVIEVSLKWAAAGYRSALVTVLSTFGASPRPPGSMAAIREDGLVIGSVSGGCVEDDIVRSVKAPGFWQQATPILLLAFGTTADERARYRLPCGNALKVAVETRWCVDQLAEAHAMIRAGQPVTRVVDYRSGVSHLEAPAGAARFSDDETGFRNGLGPRYRLLIIGASELGQYLANIAQTLDYAITVCDPRSEYADAWTLPHVTFTREMPDDVVLAFQCDERTAVVAVTHDPKLDDLALMEALRTPAFYVGALGSVATNARRRERLQEFEVTEAQAARLHGPVGLRIGSKAPAEIAVSIAAELIQVRSAMAVTSGAGG